MNFSAQFGHRSDTACLQFAFRSRKVIAMKRIFTWGLIPAALMLACGEQKETQEVVVEEVIAEKTEQKTEEKK